MTVMDPPGLRELFRDHLRGHLRGVASHRVANHGLQRLLDHAPEDVVGVACRGGVKRWKLGKGLYWRGGAWMGVGLGAWLKGEEPKGDDCEMRVGPKGEGPDGRISLAGRWWVWLGG